MIGMRPPRRRFLCRSALGGALDSVQLGVGRDGGYCCSELGWCVDLIVQAGAGLVRGGGRGNAASSWVDFISLPWQHVHGCLSTTFAQIVTRVGNDEGNGTSGSTLCTSGLYGVGPTVR